jgi:hypothetical protein
MKQKNPSFQARDAASFRLARQHLTGAEPADVVSICGDICGAQAQLMTAAYLQIWARNHALRKTEAESALWQKRSLVKTHLMRQTLHLIPVTEFGIYISALKSCRVADALRVMKRCGIGAEEGHSLTPLILDALSDGPAGRAAITAAVRPKVSKRVQSWMDKVWSITRIPVAEGLVCYGPGEGNQVTLILSNGWLRAEQLIAEEAARMELLRRYLGAYGPATLADFAHWAGLPSPQVRPLREGLGEELCEVYLDGRPCLLLRDDLRFLGECSALKTQVRLLPHFDPYLLAHREKDHLLAPRHYKRVYRNQGWISPVVLLDGEIAAVWSYQKKSKNLYVTVEPFDRVPRAVRAAIAQEAESLAGFFNSKLEIVFTT